MIYKNWKTFYEKILKDFNFDRKKDIKSAELLDKILSGKDTSHINILKDLISKKNVLVFAAGPSLTKSIEKYRDSFENFVIVCADGATTALLKYEIIPDIIVTDLDGKVSDQIKANKKGSIVLIHAHGDNIDRIEKYTREFDGKIIGTTQNDPTEFKNLYNFGGFTDGDRCVFLADHFRAEEIILLGFDYNKKIGKYSLPERKDLNLKYKKLEWCEHLIEQLKSENSKIKYD